MPSLKSKIAELETKQKEILEERNSYCTRLSNIKEMLDSRYNYTDEQAIKDISNLQDYKRSNEGAIDMRICILRDENSRLWYLLRAVMKDETLKENPAIDYHTNKPPRPFNNPQF